MTQTLKWVSAQNGVPTDPVVGGHERPNRDIIVARAAYQGGIHPGKLDNGTGKVYIGYSGEEVVITSSYEILVATGLQSAIRWVAVEGTFTIEKLNGAVPVVGGYIEQESGQALFVTRMKVDNDITHCGKVWIGANHAHIPYQGKEHKSSNYEVLCMV